MSILPSQTQGSTSSSHNIVTNPSSEHGNNHSITLSQNQISFGSLNISDPQPPQSMCNQPSDPLVSAAANNGGSSKEVTELGTPSSMNSFPQQNGERQSPSPSAGQRAQPKGKKPGGTFSPQGQHSTGKIKSQGSNQHNHSAGKRAHMISGNHLLNFQYDPIARAQPRGPAPPPPRRQHKRKPYNKDLFLQANYRFVVLDTGNYAPEAMDPDKMLRWDDIICLRYSTPFPVQCPICLEYPMCPQITSCGHIFCFPCILQYLLIGEEDHKGDCFKRCPLCFVMVSTKDLYTVYIESVKQCCVGDTIDFMLLSRQKDSFTLSRKNEQEACTMASCKDETSDPFSKFVFTSDIDLSVRQAMSELDGWLARADSGLVDDIEKLPYVCAALEQLEQRKKYWNGHQDYEKNRPLKVSDRQMGLLSNLNVSAGSGHGAQATNFLGTNKGLSNNSDGETCVDKNSDEDQSQEGHDTILSPAYDRSKGLQNHSNGFGEMKDNSSYNFYQAVDGQHIILHSLNMKCLLQHYGSYDMLPHRVRGKILQLETVTQSEAIRRRYRYLSHFSLTTTFQLCEIELSGLLPYEALIPFMDEIKKRENSRKQLAKKERREKIRAEAAAAAEYIPIVSSFGQSSHDFPAFSMDDFEALGSSTAMSSSPPVVGERKLFANVARLGFAAGHDSPALKIEERDSAHNNDSTGLRNSGMPSFANITSRAKPIETLDAPRVNETGRKGKKQNRVLLSTSGGRRY